MCKRIRWIKLLMPVIVLYAPALATASTGLTVEGKTGTLILVGSRITKVNVGTVTVTDARIGDSTCSTVMLKGKVTKDSENTGVEGEGEGEGTASGCLINGHSITVTAIKLVDLSSTVTESGKGTASFSFTANLPELTCKFSGTNDPGTYTPNTDRIKFEKAKLSVTPAACGEGFLDAEFTIETTASPNTPVLIM